MQSKWKWLIAGGLTWLGTSKLQSWGAQLEERGRQGLAEAEAAGMEPTRHSAWRVLVGLLLAAMAWIIVGDSGLGKGVVWQIVATLAFFGLGYRLYVLFTIFLGLIFAGGIISMLLDKS